MISDHALVTNTSTINAIRPGYVLNTENDYDDLGNDSDNVVCEPCFQESEEGISAKHKKIIQQPTAEEVLQHEISHVPFRSWCKFCIMGKGVASPHLKSCLLYTSPSPRD